MRKILLWHMHDLLSIFYDFFALFSFDFWVCVVRMSHGPCVSRVTKVGLKDMACHPSGSYHAPQTPYFSDSFVENSKLKFYILIEFGALLDTSMRVSDLS